MKNNINQSAFDCWSLGHILMGQFGTFFFLPILFFISQFIKFEIGFFMLLFTITIGAGWEYIENGVFKSFKIFKDRKIVIKIFGGKLLKIDSWCNCITDVLLVIVGMLTLLPFGYLFLPDLVIFSGIALIIIIITLIVMIFLIARDRNKLREKLRNNRIQVESDAIY